MFPAGTGEQITSVHGLGVRPKLVQVTLKCVTADAGYSIGDEIILNASSSIPNHYAPVYRVDATNVYVNVGNNNLGVILHKTTGLSTALTSANWKFVIRAWA